MKLNFKNQVILSVALVILGNLLGTVYQSWIYRSASFVISGVIWIVNPVLGAGIPETEENIKWARVAGVILILIGVFTRSNT